MTVLTSTGKLTRALATNPELVVAGEVIVLDETLMINETGRIENSQITLKTGAAILGLGAADVLMKNEVAPE